ncbi:MAG: glycosyltransferase family 2 protein [Prevotella sp.]|nr:glycosyltransferase family 2 protein [Prevotella sp.]
MQDPKRINDTPLSTRLQSKPLLAIVVPCYNEQTVLQETAKQLFNKIQNLISNNIVSSESKIVFVDDGSTDNTWNVIESYYLNNPNNFAGIKLSRNRGHQNALLGGLLSIKNSVDVVISIDADLQDDISVMAKMIDKYRNGDEIIYGVKSKRETDSFFKRTSAECFYKFMRFLGADIIYNHADFRLMGKAALSALAEYSEVNLFLRGIIPMLGFKSSTVFYEQKKRFAGFFTENA